MNVGQYAKRDVIVATKDGILVITHITEASVLIMNEPMAITKSTIDIKA